MNPRTEIVKLMLMHDIKIQPVEEILNSRAQEKKSVILLAVQYPGYKKFTDCSTLQELMAELRQLDDTAERATVYINREIYRKLKP